jgi:hypothetical protein
MTRGAGVYLQVFHRWGPTSNSHGSDVPWRFSHRFFLSEGLFTQYDLTLWLLPTLESNTRQAGSGSTQLFHFAWWSSGCYSRPLQLQASVETNSAIC